METKPNPGSKDAVNRLKQYRPAFLRGALLSSDALEPRFCRKCPTRLPPNVKYYCCGDHLLMAKLDGSYGNEEATPL